MTQGALVPRLPEVQFGTRHLSETERSTESDSFPLAAYLASRDTPASSIGPFDFCLSRRSDPFVTASRHRSFLVITQRARGLIALVSCGCP